MVPLMLVIGNRSFGISNNLGHLCAITQPRQMDVDFFKYNWKDTPGACVFMVGTALDGFLAGVVFGNPDPRWPLPRGSRHPRVMGFRRTRRFAVPAGSLVPPELFAPTVRNLTFLFTAGVRVGFDTRYAGGCCTSGHAITGLSTLQLASFHPVLGIFAGGLLSSWLLVRYC